jgi:maltoporin
MKAARESHETRMAELERRLAAIEGSPVASTAASASPTAPAAATGAPADLEARVAALEKQGGELDAFKSTLQNFEFHGYLRAGYGVNQSGGGQEQVTSPDGLFQIGPGRLGNEADTYGELTFKYGFPAAGENAAQFGFQSTLAFKYSGDKSNYTVDEAEGADLLFREAFVTAGNVLKSAPEVTFWAGQRFYDRHDIHIYDYYVLDTSGYGGGVEKINLGPGKFAAAYLGGTDATSLVDGRFSLTKQILDFRWSELPSLGGQGTLWVSPQYVNGGSGVNPDKTAGLAVGWIQHNPLSKGYNKAILQYGFGAGYQFGTYVSGISFQPKGALDDGRTLQFTDQLVWQFNDRFSLMWAGIANWEDKGFRTAAESASDRLFLSTAVRPIYMLTQNVGLATEFGFDWVDDVRYTLGKDSTTLGKITFAPVIRPSGDFWARPELRLYASYFFWNDAPDFYRPNGTDVGDNSSWSFGVQVETWW